MRIGFWNRLAVVAFVVGTFGIPTWWVLSTNQQISDTQQSAYATCVAAAEQRKDWEARSTCWDILMGGQSRFYGWPEWKDALLASAMGLAVCYLIIAAAVVTARWVWRGRQA